MSATPSSLLKTPYLMHSRLTFAFFKCISHWLWIEKFKMTNYMWICFSFWVHGPEFIEFPVHIERVPLHFVLFANFNCFWPVADPFFLFLFILWNFSPFLCCWCCSTMYYLHISLVYKIITKLLINEWSQDQFQGNPTTNCLQMNASSSSTACFHSRTLA